MRFFKQIRHRTTLSILLLSPFVSVSHAGQSIDVSLKTSFPSPPFLLELLETAAEENSTAYFPLLKRIADGHFSSAKSDVQLYNSFLKLLQDDGHITDPPTLSSFKLALSLHSVAPRIAAHFQSYETSVAPSRECPQWISVNGKQHCQLPLSDAEGVDVEIVSNDLPFDWVDGSDSAKDHWILYADVIDSSFGSFYRKLRTEISKKHDISLSVRYRPSAESKDSVAPLFVSGYGVKMSLKRTDYIVIDDRQATKEGDAETVEEGTTVASSHAQVATLEDDEEISDLKPLSASELTRLSLKASSFIMSSEDPFDTLQKLSSDFPKYSSLVAAHNVTKEFSAEFYKNRQAFLPAGYNKIWINGQEINKREMEPFALLEHLRKEKKLMRRLERIGLENSEAIRLLSYPSISETMSNDEPQRFDWRDDIEGQGTILWLNDIEKDSRYAEWPSGLGALLQRTYPGQLPTVRRNLHHMVLPIDLSNPEDVTILIETIQPFIKRALPLRFGLVLRSDHGVADRQAKIFYHLMKAYGISAALSYIEAALFSQGLGNPTKTHFENVIRGRELRRDQAALGYDELFEAQNALEYLESAQAYMRRLSLEGAEAPILINGILVPRGEQWLSVMSQHVTRDLRVLQQAVFEDQFTEESSLSDHLLSSAVTRRNALIAPEDNANLHFIDLDGLITSHGSEYTGLPKVGAVEATDVNQWAHLIVISDFVQPAGLELLRAASDFATRNSGIELVVLQRSYHSEFPSNREYDRNKLDEIISEIERIDKPSTEATDGASMTSSLAEAIGIRDGETGVVFNGRLIKFGLGTPFTTEDFATLHDFESSKRAKPVIKAADRIRILDKLTDPLSAAKLISLISLVAVPDTQDGIYEASPPTRINDFISWASKYSGISLGDSATAIYQIVVALDPASETAQKWVSILKVLSDIEGVSLKISLNPVERLTELPVKGFYRQVLNAQPAFGDDGAVTAPSANFAGLPKEALLTMAMEVPPAWLVVPKNSIHDLDNIKLSSIKGGSDIKAVYELEHILIEGHSREVPTGQPPRGTKLVLGTTQDPHFADTIVMANLGYFQFKVNPGVWTLSLQGGKTSEVYNLDSGGTKGYKPQPGDHTTDIVLTSFQGKTIFPRISRRPGQENVDVLEGTDSVHGNAMDFVAKGVKMANEALSSMGFKKSQGSQDGQADINIFSVASGHLYERMLNIMMVSVMRHTQHTVKFWFIENFLSPSFKDFIPTLAKEYGFQYELVTYKWPHWLRAQSEKQREIWGYKILFLDVLFPLSLKKVIFVDADQIVRTDMYDLVEHDLEGAPYGFTPMCDSRTSMEGFRFWKQGYWANFLRGKPYHISALYVVDLVKFRAIAAGDRLRQQYHQLSADPESLSNLDQDLPNHMQHMLPIHSLPQSWLWCETWCSDEELADARTIDLCNNPQTKEPKLDRARRQVPEWTEYDDEIEQLRTGKGKRPTSDGQKNPKSRAHEAKHPKDEL